MAKSKPTKASLPAKANEHKPPRADDSASAEAERAQSRKEKPKPDGDAIAEIGDAVGGPA